MSAAGFWIIGCGNMAGAMLSRWIETGIDAGDVRVVDPAMPALPGGIVCLPAIPGDVAPAARVLLGVKPQMLGDVADEVARLIGPETQLLSILAGIEIETLRRFFPGAAAVTRVMPNLPVALGKGVVTLYASAGPDPRVTDLMAPLGQVEWLADESLMHLATALAGSGPAFVYRFIDALASAGADQGLDPAQAGRLALAMVEGAVALAAQSAESPATLAARVTSKGGTTFAGLGVLDESDALAGLVGRAIAAARDRSISLGEEARPA